MPSMITMKQQQQQRQRNRQLDTMVVPIIIIGIITLLVASAASTTTPSKTITNISSSSSGMVLYKQERSIHYSTNYWNATVNNQIALMEDTVRYKNNNHNNDNNNNLYVHPFHHPTIANTYPLVVRNKQKEYYYNTTIPTTNNYTNNNDNNNNKKRLQQRRRKLQILCRIRKSENCHSSFNNLVTSGCIKNQDALQEAIKNAVPKTERLPTIITLCSTIIITNRIPLNNNLYAFDVSNKNIQFQCAGRKCTIDATTTRSGILYGSNTKLSIQNIELKNAGNRTNGGNCLNDNDYSHPCGGAIHFINNSSITISDSTFSNHASKMGGAISITNSLLQISSTSFINNAAIVGGAIAAGNSIVTLQHSRFERNCCKACGGGISSYNGTIVTLLENVTFIGNVADLGGAISLIQSNLTTGNTTNQQPPQRQRILRRLLDSSGTLTSYDFPILTPTATFIQNSASDGGAIVASDSVLLIDGIQFRSNIASERGGALSLQTSVGQFFNCLFVSNQAQSEGGAVLLMSSTSSPMSNVRFDKNKAFVGGALDVSFDSSTSIKDGIFFKNSASIGSAARFIASDDAIRLTRVSFLYNGGEGSMTTALKTENLFVQMKNCTFLENRRKDDTALANINMFGGGVQCDQVTFCIDCPGNLTPSDCVNSTIVTGGGVFTNCVDDGLIGNIGTGFCVQPPNIRRERK